MMIKLLVVFYFAIIINITFAQNDQFHIKSVATNEFLQAPVGPEAPLTLGNSNTAGTWTIDPPPDPNRVVVSTIYDQQADLYASVNQAAQGDEIIAVSDSYEFNIARTPEGSYVIFPIGPGLFWASNSTISPHIELIFGNDIKGNDGFFDIIPVV
ncbi:uncharacterized protein BX664DRAFT_323209 [Halteromyces radiatus]|uniref:uncharacterized protein n=1 Tax=Halteromyces radiatus TaxID=101107 RepID=UPI00221EDC5C|nr:uncharacterized protein BX664DRAFT_323209 [Halteromyces radiatus]KAI8096145.1 hypothetical protein BX664DRAFT_323209 [Halteromyces radiatus]